MISHLGLCLRGCHALLLQFRRHALALALRLLQLPLQAGPQAHKRGLLCFQLSLQLLRLPPSPSGPMSTGNKCPAAPSLAPGAHRRARPPQALSS